jgi:hypothetical protein
MSRSVKRNATLLTVGAAWMLAMHLVDVIWLIMPTVHPTGSTSSFRTSSP